MAGIGRSRVAATPYGRRLVKLVVVTTLVLAGCTSTSADDEAPSAPSSSAPATADAVQASVDAFFANDFADAYRNRRAVLVSVAGDVIVEDYFESDPATTTNIQSVGKSIVATLIGLALADGHLNGLDQTLAELLPEDATAMSSTTKQITLRQLLTMTSGLPTDEAFYLQVLDQPDWVRYMLASGPATAPSAEFAYSSAGSHLLSAILQHATGMTTLEYARERLSDPLGISTTPETPVLATTADLPAYDAAVGFTWPTDPQGVHIGGGGLKLTAGDMLKLGRLWLEEGRWGGEELVPATWLQEATQSHVQSMYPVAPGYGYQFWVTEADGHPAFCAF